MSGKRWPEHLQPARYYKATTFTGATPDAWEEVDWSLVPSRVRSLLGIDHPEACGVSVHHELTSDHYRIDG